MSELDILRKKIDDIDHEIVKLLEKRMDISKEIKTVKIHKNISVLDSNREKEILDRIFCNEKYAQGIAEIYKVIMNVSKDLQKK